MFTPASQVRFARATAQQVMGSLKATGSSDLDVLAAAKDQIASPYRPLKWIGIWGIVVGVMLTMTIILGMIGIPLFVFGVWAFRRARQNAATIDAAYDAYLARVTGAAPPSLPQPEQGVAHASRAGAPASIRS